MEFQRCLLIEVVFFVQLLMLGVHGNSRICNRTIRAQDSARSLYEETKISMISPRPRQQCPLNGLSLMDPRFNHIVVFFKRNRSFHLCATLHDPGMATYRIKGTSKQLIERSNSSGSLGCFESECKHLTILMEPGREMNAERIHISYTYNEIRKTPKCTEVCQLSCLCNSKYVFIGNLKYTIRDNIKGGLYRLYFKIAEFIRYNGIYTGSFHTYHRYVCNNNYNSSYNSTSDDDNNNSIEMMDVLPPLPVSPVPTLGLVKVYSKTPLLSSGKHLVTGSVHLVRGKRGLFLCCVQEEESYAVNVLRDLMFRQRCC